MKWSDFKSGDLIAVNLRDYTHHRLILETKTQSVRHFPGQPASCYMRITYLFVTSQESLIFRDDYPSEELVGQFILAPLQVLRAGQVIYEKSYYP